MGEVFKGTYLGLEVAVKRILASHQSEEYEKAFLKEIETQWWVALTLTVSVMTRATSTSVRACARVS